MKGGSWLIDQLPQFFPAADADKKGSAASQHKSSKPEIMGPPKPQ